MARTLLRLFDQTKPGSYNTGIKKEVRVASTADIDLTTGGPLTVDTVSAIAGDRVLVKAQTLPAENGIYVVAAGAWLRAPDSDETGEVLSAEVVFVSEGSSGNINTGWILSTNGIITVGTTAQTWEKFTTMNAVTSGSFIIGELVAGTMNGANVTFTVANSPIASKFALYYNGQRLRAGATEDYTISGLTITMAFAPKSTPGQTDVLLADYLF